MIVNANATRSQLWIEPTGQVHEFDDMTHGKWAMDKLGMTYHPPLEEDHEGFTKEIPEGWKDDFEVDQDAQGKLLDAGWIRMGFFRRGHAAVVYVQKGSPLTPAELGRAQTWIMQHPEWQGPSIDVQDPKLWTVPMADFLAAKSTTEFRGLKTAAGPIPLDTKLIDRVYNAVVSNIQGYWGNYDAPIGERELSIAFSLQSTPQNVAGEERVGMNLRLVFEDAFLSKAVRGAELYPGKWPTLVVYLSGKLTGQDIVKRLQGLEGFYLRGILTHELAHVFDHIPTEGASVDPKEDAKAYYNLPAEVHAYATQLWHYIVTNADYYREGGEAWLAKTGEKGLWSLVDSALTLRIGNNLRRYGTPKTRRYILQVAYRAMQEVLEGPESKAASLKVAEDAGITKADLQRIRPILREWVAGGWTDGPDLMRLLEKHKDVLAKFRMSKPVRLWRNERAQTLTRGGQDVTDPSNRGWEDQYTRPSAWSATRMHAESYASGNGRRLVTAIVPPEDTYCYIPLVDQAARALGMKTFDPMQQDEVIVRPNPSFLEQIRPKVTNGEEAQLRRDYELALLEYHLPQLQELRKTNPKAISDEELKRRIGYLAKEKEIHDVRDELAKLRQGKAARKNAGILEPGFSVQAACRPTRYMVMTVAQLSKAAHRTQWDTPEFKAWFAGSKIVNADGTPKVLYHGTATPGIYTFDGTSYSDRGVSGFFTEDPDFAGTFADAREADELEKDPTDDSGNTIPDPRYPHGPQIYPVYIRALHVFDVRNPEHFRRVRFRKHQTGEPLDYTNLEEQSGAIWEAGFDAYLDFEHGHTKPPTGLAVRSPGQIKSAIGNSGKFEPTDHRITASAHHYQPKRVYDGDVLVTLDVAKVDASWRRDKTFYIEPGGGNQLRGRYDRFAQWLQDNQGTPIDPPDIGLTPSGEIIFGNGRHRFAVLRDLGQERIAATVPRADLDEMVARFGAQPVQGTSVVAAFEGAYRWVHGDCFEWAYAAYELLGGALYTVCGVYSDDEASGHYHEDYTTFHAHAFVSFDGGQTGWDASGRYPVANLCRMPWFDTDADPPLRVDPVRWEPGEFAMEFGANQRDEAKRLMLAGKFRVFALMKVEAPRHSVTAKTLYHGTSTERAKHIQREGLEPQVGDLTATAYEDDAESVGDELEPLTFAGDKDALQRGVYSAMLHAIQAEGHDITDAEQAIRNWGALVILKDGDERMEHRPETEDPYGYSDHPLQVETGDYYSREGLEPDHILTGPTLVRYLKRNGVNLSRWTKPFSEQKRNALVGMVRRAHPDVPVEKILEKVNALTFEQFHKSWDYYVKLEKGKAASNNEDAHGQCHCTVCGTEIAEGRVCTECAKTCRKCGGPTRNCKCASFVHAKDALCHDCWGESKTASADAVHFQEHSISAGESSFEGTKHPGVRVEMTMGHDTVGALEYCLDGEKAYVRGITVAPNYRSQGFGQQLYDEGIASARRHGATTFYSDQVNAMSPDAHKAWGRIRQRHPVTFESGEGGYDSTGRHRIDLKTATLTKEDIQGRRRALEAFFPAELVQAAIDEAPDGETYTMPLDEALDEHERLIQVLKSPDHTDDLQEAQEQEAELRKMKAAGSVTIGFNVNDSEMPWTEMILAGKKTIETRDSDSLRPHVGERVGIVRTGHGPATLVGYCTLGDPKVYRTNEEFRADNEAHQIPAGPQWDLRPGAVKFGYPLTDVEACEPQPVDGQGRVFRRIAKTARYLTKDDIRAYARRAEERTGKSSRQLLEELYASQDGDAFPGFVKEASTSVFYHGTNAEGDFETLKSSVTGILWLTDDLHAATSYAMKHYHKGPATLWKVTLRDGAKLVALWDLSDPIVRAIKEQASTERRMTIGFGISDENWVRQAADFGMLEAFPWVVRQLRAKKVDGVWVHDEHAGRKHLSLALLNKSAIIAQEQAALRPEAVHA